MAPANFPPPLRSRLRGAASAQGRRRPLQLFPARNCAERATRPFPPFWSVADRGHVRRELRPACSVGAVANGSTASPWDKCPSKPHKCSLAGVPEDRWLQACLCLPIGFLAVHETDGRWRPSKSTYRYAFGKRLDGRNPSRNGVTYVLRSSRRNAGKRPYGAGAAF